MAGYEKRATSLAAVVATIALCGLETPAIATDFLRGDVNEDGRVSISDAWFLLLHEFWNGEAPGCLEAADSDANGYINVTDSVRILNHLFLGQPELAPPFPEPGPGSELAGHDCASYGGGTLVDDAGALLEVLDASVPGGEDGTATIIVALSASRALAGYSFSIRMDPVVVARVSSWEARDLTGTLADDDGFLGGCYRDGRLDLGFLASVSDSEEEPLPRNSGEAVIEIPICLKEGARAGAYRLVPEDGELTDRESGRAIRPRLAGGSLVVASDLSPGAGCEPYPCPPPRDPREDDPPEQLNAVFELRGRTAAPDQTFSVPLIVRADAWIQGFSFSIDFDEEVLEATATEKLFENPNGFTEIKFNNKNEHPGNGGVDEGYVYGAFAMSTVGEEQYNLPPDEDHEVCRLHFRVRPEVTQASTEIAFLDGARQTNPIINVLVAFARGYTPETAASFVFVDAHVNVLPEISTFIRGDSNGDGAVNLSDAEHTLGHLFLGGQRPACYDSADANDDGVIDITDPLRTLTFLFLGHGVIPPPYPSPGEDSTEDLLGCLWRR